MRRTARIITSTLFTILLPACTRQTGYRNVEINDKIVRVDVKIDRKQVLEVGAGWANKNQIKEGDSLEINL